MLVFYEIQRYSYFNSTTPNVYVDNITHETTSRNQAMESKGKMERLIFVSKKRFR